MIQCPLFRRSLALVLLLVIPSCSRQSSLTTQPDLGSTALRADAGIARSQLNREPGDFYPLAVGNQWTYEVKLISEVVGPDGNVIERTENTIEQQQSIDCSFQAGGHEWFIRRIQWPHQEPVLRALYQDRSGLHGLERLSTIDPCASSVLEGGLSVEELRYPLRPGSTWILKDEPFGGGQTVVTVESHEVIETPAGRFPAVRLHVKEPIPLPYVTYYWYGREGLLAIESRVEAGAGAPGFRVRHITTIRLKSLSVASAAASMTARTDRLR